MLSLFIKIFTISTLFLSVCGSMFGQQNATSLWDGWGIESTVKMGTMIKHTASFTGPISQQVYGTEINFIQNTHGRKPWQEIRNYPTIGVAVNYLNYNNNTVYGHAFGISPNIILPLWKRNKWEWTFKAGMGVGLVTKHYKKETNNTQNTAIGGKINNVSPFSTDLRYKLNNKWHFQVGAYFTHVSNATFQTPNLGINTYGAHIGFRYFPTTTEAQKIIRSERPTYRNNWMGFAKGSIAFVEKGPADGPTYLTYIAHLGIAKRYASKNKVYAGVDAHFHDVVYQYNIYHQIPTPNAFRSAGQLALFVGHEFVFGRVGVIGQVGYYFLPYTTQTIRLYQKIGGHYYFVKKEHGLIKEVFASALLKTHLSVAELFEMGLGISF